MSAVTESKTNAGIRHVFVPRWAADAVAAHVREQNRSGSDAIFTIPRRTVQKEHKRACEDAGIDDYTIHDHRHTAAVALARAGVPLQNLQGQLGHANITQTMKYALFHPEYSDLSPYFDRVAQRFGLNSTGNRSGYHQVSPPPPQTAS